MSPLLKGIYESPGGSECLDVLMKYMWVVLYPVHSVWANWYAYECSYKGMSMGHTATSPKSPSKVTPQSTGGFSQIGSRPGASNEPAAGALSVLLSWHERLVEVTGLGCIGRTMTDWRRV